jgi:hypothetical protein
MIALGGKQTHELHLDSFMGRKSTRLIGDLLGFENVVPNSATFIKSTLDT